MKHKAFILLTLVLTVSPLMAEDEDRVLFTFDNTEAAKPWQTVNDGVMGGRSVGRFKVNENKKMEFFGTLSLENNGGFASVRARGVDLGLEKDDVIVARVRGDGREYNFNLYSQRTRNSYRQSFKTNKDEWIEVRLPVDKFVATWRGRVFPNEKLDPSNVTGMGILLGDKKAGPFKLEVDWIKVTSDSVGANGIRVQRDIAYVEKGHERHKLDVYAPTGGKDHPIAIWIHGGGWKKGDKTGVQSKPKAFVEKGLVFVSVNYRFVPDVGVTEMAGDIAKAIQWVHDHAGEYGGSPDTIFVMGHSAGAHLAALICTDDRYLKAEGLSLANIKGCVPVDTAAYDVPSQVKSIGPLRNTTYTSVFGEDEKSQKGLSPMTYVAEGKDIPSFLILHVASRIDSTARSMAFADALKQAGVGAKVFAAEGKNHGTINRELGLPDDPPTKALFEFMNGALTLGFDASKVRPPDAEKGEPVARLFYDYIFPADIGVASPKLTEDEARRLTDKIFGEVRRRYMDRHNITATPEEIQQFVAAIRSAVPAKQDVSQEKKEDDRRGYEAIGEQMVKGWKLDRMLYEKYGGTVIFQQGNPFEPVGAYRKFLEEMEEAEVFEVSDPDNRQKFWHYLVRQHPFQVPPEQIDFDEPWWMQKK